MKKLLLSSFKKFFMFALQAIVLSGVLIYTTIKAPEIHDYFLTEYIKDKVFYIKQVRSLIENGGGGTGFAVKAKSGKTYILTNAHVCISVLNEKNEVLLQDSQNHVFIMPVLEISNLTDICIIKAPKKVKGLSLASEDIFINQSIRVLGHPELKSLTLTKGEIVRREDTILNAGVVVDSDSPCQICELIFQLYPNVGYRESKYCNGPMYFTETISVNLGFLDVGVDICKAFIKNTYVSSAIVKPGSSGSPLLNIWGRIVGVVFATDLSTGWAISIPLEQVKDFLEKY